MYKLKSNMNLINAPVLMSQNQLDKMELCSFGNDIVDEIRKFYIEKELYESCYLYQHVQGGTTTSKINMTTENIVIFQEILVGFWFEGYFFSCDSLEKQTNWIEDDASDLPGTECKRKHRFCLKKTCENAETSMKDNIN